MFTNTKIGLSFAAAILALIGLFAIAAVVMSLVPGAKVSPAVRQIWFAPGFFVEALVTQVVFHIVASDDAGKLSSPSGWWWANDNRSRLHIDALRVICAASVVALGSGVWVEFQNDWRTR